ncbi:peptidoglycan-binding protein [Streptomyces griseosporeus]|uniref:peptidoglycan-binding protein n=1 Tax=Streptomyces griseosporeus TaxID=1910 RepID=UPI0036FF7B9D
MSRWKALPAELDPRVRQLVVRLRRLKDHAGLSMRQLAARTGYSEKSWERYLGGRTLPPREAVTELARACGENPTRLLALHEVAAEAWRTGAGSPPAPEAPEPAEPSGRRSLRIALVAGSVALVLAVCAAVLLTVRLTGGDTGQASAARTSAPRSAPPPASPSAPTYTCRPHRADGHWYTGNSRTRDAVLVNGLAGPEVAEAQCLLRRAGFSPGVIDGIFGPKTEAAVRQLQARAGLVVDGIIGPHTWEALRR